MMTGIIPGKKKRSCWLWLAGALFLFVVLILMVWNRNLAKKSADPLTAGERAWLKARSVIRLAPDPDFPPVEYFDKNGGYTGITADYVALIEKKLGIRFEIVRLRNWDEIISKAKSRQIDAYVATKTPQRAEYMLFTRPYLEFPVVIITREKVESPLTLEKLSGMKVSVVSEYAAHNFIVRNYPNLHLDPVPDVRTGLRKVSFGLSDAFVENLATATYYIEKEGITNLRIAGESGFFYRMGFCSRKDWPELNRILEKGLSGISTDEKKAVYKKWIPVEPRSLFSSSEFQTGLLAALAAILFIVAVIIAWNRALARQVRLRTMELENELAERKRMEEELQHARDELEKRVEERTAELRNANELLEREITMRKRTENVNMARLRLLQFAGNHSLDQLLEATLDEAEALTGSLIGFYRFLEADQKTLSLQNWSARTKAEFCKAEGKGSHYDISTAGVWVDCVHERRPVVHNDYASLPHRKGMPPGHGPVIRELVVPVFRGDKIVAILGVGNKLQDYTSENVEVVSLLADLAWEITERKRAEEKLKESEERLRLTMEATQIGAFEWDIRSDRFIASPTYYTMLGYEPKIGYGDRVERCECFQFHPEDKAHVLDKIAQVLTGIFDEYVYEARILHADGTYRWQFVKGISIERDEEGKGARMLGIRMDITERKRVEEELRASQEKYRSMVEAYDGFIYICSQDYLIEFMNRKLIERTGRDATGGLCYEALHGRDSACPWCVNERVFAGETVHWEIQSPKDCRWYHVVNVPIYNANGTVSKHSVIADIHDLKLTEEKLREQKQLLTELNDTLERRVREEVAINREKDIMLMQQNRQAALGEMLDHIAHQWKQPLNSIALIVQDVADTSSDGELTNEDVQATTGKIMSLLEHMAQTIEVFRGFHRQDKEKKVFSIKDSVDQALAFIAPAFRFHYIAVELDVDPGLTAFGYAKEYAQVLLNILANARDVFRARGTEKPRVAIRAFAEDHKTVVTIADNAGGIPETIIGKIFDFYFTTNEAGGGTGIGLYMSKNIIEKNMGGTLSAVNTEEGAQFRIEVSPT